MAADNCVDEITDQKFRTNFRIKIFIQNDYIQVNYIYVEVLKYLAMNGIECVLLYHPFNEHQLKPTKLFI